MVPWPDGKRAGQPGPPSWRELADGLWLAAAVQGELPATRPPPSTEDTEPAGPAPPVASGPGGGTPAGSAPPVDEPAVAPRLVRTRTESMEVDRSGESMVAALPRSQWIARALRPFKRLVLSTHETEPDEEATAEHAADTGLWLPRSRAVRSRWLSLVLVVDSSPSMAVWRPTTTALRLMLERHGAFRSVRTFLLVPGDGTQGPRVHGPGGGPRRASELRDPAGRQLTLVFTDGIGPLWHDPRTDRLLRLWGRSGPLAILNPFPQDRWYRTRLQPRRCQLSAPRAAAPNERLRVRYPDEYTNPFAEPVDGRSLPIPLLELDARWIDWWAGLVTGTSTGWVNGLVHAVDPSAPPSPGPPEAPMSGRDRVARFRRTASATAFRLATYAAAAPLDLPLLRRVQRAMLPQSAPHHLAEVLTSDLVERSAGGGDIEFVEGVREALLACSTRDESGRVIRTMAAHHRRGDGTGVAFTRVIEAPDHTPAPAVTPETLPMARIELAVLNALSGPYARRASRLREAIDAAERGVSPSPEKPPQPVPAPVGGPLLTHPDAAGTGRPEDGDAAMQTHPDPNRPRVDAGAGGIPPTIFDPDLPEDDPIHSLRAFLEGPEHETGPEVWGAIPTRNPVFTGRRALLEQLERRLETQRVAAVLPQALHGEGGVGKSQIAIEYAYRHRGDYDVIWWVPSERPAQILASIIELGNRLGLDVGNEVITAVPKVREALRAGTPHANWLLIFDNAETPDTVREYIPDSGTGKVIVTSRRQEWGQISGTLEVDVFDRSESVELLQARNPELSAEDADRLAEALGDLPLAIEHASAWVATTRMQVDEYLALLAEKRTELTTVVSSPGYEMPVAAAANVALDRLAAENPAALQLLQVCSFFAPEPIDWELFTGPRSTPIADDLDEALQDQSQFDRALSDIQRYVLAKIDYRSQTIQLHRLVQAVLRGRMPDDQRGPTEHGAHILLAGGGKPGEPSDQTHWLRYQALASHLTASNATGCEEYWARELVLNLVEFYYYWGDYRSGRNLAQQVVDLWRGMPSLGPDHRQTLKAQKWLAYYLWTEGEFEKATEITTQSLGRYRRTVGSDHPESIDAMNMVALTHRASGRFADARDTDLEAFRLAKQVFGGAHPHTLRAAHSLGVSLRLTGEFRTARQLDGHTYRTRVGVLGHDHPETLRTLNNLTIDERECGDYVRSRQLVENLYQRYVGLFGVEHPETIKVARNLAVARRRAGEHELAYKLAEDTMGRFEDRFGPLHHDAIAAALNFAVDIRETGALDRARELAALTAERYHTTLGPEHPYTLYARTNLGVVLRLMGDHTAARAHNETAWRTLTRLLGSGHVLTLTCAINLASDRIAMGDPAGAEALDRETLEHSRQVIGAAHPSTLACELNLALDLVALGRQAEGDTLFAETLEAYARVLGATHPAIAAARDQARANCDVDPMPL